MQWITVATPAFASVEEFDKVHDRLLAERGGEHDGLQARYVGTAPDGTVRVIAVWQTKADADSFFATRLGAARAEALSPNIGAPDVDGIAVARTYTRGPVA